MTRPPLLFLLREAGRRHTARVPTTVWEVGLAGFEPATRGLKAPCSNQAELQAPRGVYGRSFAIAARRRAPPCARPMPVRNGRSGRGSTLSAPRSASRRSRSKREQLRRRFEDVGEHLRLHAHAPTGEAHDLHAAIGGQHVTLDQLAILEPVDQPRRHRRIAREHLGDGAHRQRLVRLQRREDAQVPRREPEGLQCMERLPALHAAPRELGHQAPHVACDRGHADRPAPGSSFCFTIIPILRRRSRCFNLLDLSYLSILDIPQMIVAGCSP